MKEIVFQIIGAIVLLCVMVGIVWVFSKDKGEQKEGLILLIVGVVLAVLWCITWVM